MLKTLHKSMRKLSWLTVGFTYFLMVWGNLVSSTGSGLACPDWPLCHGTVTPPVRPDIILEWGHRVLAFTATCLIVATLYQVFSNKQSDPALKKSGKSLLALLAVQILLGGTTVLLGLSVIVSTVHLIIATLVFSGLITVAAVSTWGTPAVLGETAKVRRLALAGLGAMIVQIALGGLVRHSHFGLSCSQFPNCLDSFLPIPLNPGTLLAFAHRWWGVIMLGVFVHLTVASGRVSTALGNLSKAAAGIAIVQVILGVTTVLTGLHTHTRATHAAVGYALWGVMFLLAIRAGALRGLWEVNDQSSNRATLGGRQKTSTATP